MEIPEFYKEKPTPIRNSYMNFQINKKKIPKNKLKCVTLWEMKHKQ